MCPELSPLKWKLALYLYPDWHNAPLSHEKVRLSRNKNYKQVRCDCVAVFVSNV